MAVVVGEEVVVVEEEGEKVAVAEVVGRREGRPRLAITCSAPSGTVCMAAGCPRTSTACRMVDFISLNMALSFEEWKKRKRMKRFYVHKNQHSIKAKK